MPQLLSLVGKALGSILRPSSSGDLGRRYRGDSLDNTDETQQQPWSKAQSQTASEPHLESRAQRTSVRLFLEPTRSPDYAPSLRAHPIMSEVAAESAIGRLNNPAAYAGNTSDTSGNDGGSPTPVTTYFSRASLSDTASAAGEALRQASMTNRKDEFTRDNLVAYMRWVRASRGAIKLAGKVGPAKEVAAQAKRAFRKGPYRGPSPALLLRCEHWLEVTDEQHRYGSNLRVYFDYWVAEMEAAELTPPPSPALISPSPSHTQLTALIQQTHTHPQHQQGGVTAGGGSTPSTDGIPTLSGQNRTTQSSCQSQSHQSSQEQQPAERQRNTVSLSTPLQLQQVQDSVGPLLATWHNVTSDGSLGSGGPKPSRFSADATVPVSRVSDDAELQQQAYHTVKASVSSHHAPQHVQQRPHAHAHVQSHTRAHQQQHHLTRGKHKHLHWSYHLHTSSEPGTVQEGNQPSEKLSQGEPPFLYVREGSVCQATEEDSGEFPASNRPSSDGDGGSSEAGPLRTGSLTLSPAFTHSEAGSCAVGNGRKAHDMDPGPLSSRTASAGTQVPEPWRGGTESERRRSLDDTTASQPRHGTVHLRTNSASLPVLVIPSAAAAPPPLPKAPPANSSPRRNSLCSPSRRFALTALVDMPSESQPQDQLEQQGLTGQQHSGQIEAPTPGSEHRACVSQGAGRCGAAGGEEPLGSAQDRPAPETPPLLPRMPCLGTGQAKSGVHDAHEPQAQHQRVPALGGCAVKDAANIMTPGGEGGGVGGGALLSSSNTAQRAAKLMAHRDGVGNGSSFFRWLDHGAGLEVDLADRGVSRAKLDSERVKYLTPVALLEYELDIDMDTGLLRYKRSGKLLHTGPDGRGSVDEHRRPPTPPPLAVPLSLLGDSAAAWWRCSAVDHTHPVSMPSNSSAPSAGAALQQVAGASPRSPAPAGMFGTARDSGGGAGGVGLPSRKLSAPAAAPGRSTLDAGCVTMGGSRGAVGGSLEAALAAAAGVTAAKASGGVASMSGQGSGRGGGAILLDLEVRGHSASSLNRWERPQDECDSPIDCGGSSTANSGSRRESAGDVDGDGEGDGEGDGDGPAVTTNRFRTAETISCVVPVKLTPDDLPSVETAATADVAEGSGFALGSARFCSAVGSAASSVLQGGVRQEGSDGVVTETAAVLAGHLDLTAPPPGLPPLQVQGSATGPIAVAAGLGATSPSIPIAASVSTVSTTGLKAGGGSGHQAEEREKVAKWIYVVDPELRLFVHPKVRGRFHHSSFLRGGAVVAAGGLAARHGRLRLLTADSGHYWPREENFRWLCEHLVSVGADLSVCELRSKHMSVPAATGRELMEKMGMPLPPWRLPYQSAVALETLAEGNVLQEPHEMAEGELQRD